MKKKYVNNLLYKLPIPIKIRLGYLKTLIDKKKRLAIKMANKYTCRDFSQLNNKYFRNALKKYYYACAWNSSDVENFSKWLYHDKVILINKSKMNKDFPYIICVVRNEANKLVHFFEHYNKIGQFNYIFIDNGSDDNTIDIIKRYGGTIYQCLEPFTTNRKLAWVNKVYSSLPNGVWTILLDADELLVCDGYEN